MRCFDRKNNTYRRWRRLSSYQWCVFTARIREVGILSPEGEKTRLDQTQWPHNYSVSTHKQICRFETIHYKHENLQVNYSDKNHHSLLKFPKTCALFRRQTALIFTGITAGEHQLHLLHITWLAIGVELCLGTDKFAPEYTRNLMSASLCIIWAVL